MATGTSPAIALATYVQLDFRRERRERTASDAVHVAALSEVVTDVNDVTAVYAVVCGSSAGERLCPDVARVPAQVRPTTMGQRVASVAAGARERRRASRGQQPTPGARSLNAPLTFPAPDLAHLCRFFRTSSARQPNRVIAHVDHMRTTSIPSNHGTFTNHLHIRRQGDRGPRNRR